MTPLDNLFYADYSLSVLTNCVRSSSWQKHIEEQELETRYPMDEEHVLFVKEPVLK